MCQIVFDISSKGSTQRPWGGIICATYEAVVVAQLPTPADRVGAHVIDPSELDESARAGPADMAAMSTMQGRPPRNLRAPSVVENAVCRVSPSERFIL